MEVVWMFFSNVFMLYINNEHFGFHSWWFVGLLSLFKIKSLLTLCQRQA